MVHQGRASVVLAVVGSICTAGAATAEQSAPLKAVQVTASRNPEPIDEVPASITVVTGAELLARGAHDLRTALSLAAGVEGTPGGDGGPAGAVPALWGLREVDAFLLVVDGVPWGGAFSPATPSICAVNGYAFGGGLEMAMSCDIRIASENAQFAAPEIKLGWIGGGGMAMHLAHSIGMSNAALMLMTGDPIDAGRALAWGLVSEVVSRGRLLDRAREIAGTIATRAPIAAETAKLNLKAAHAMPPETAIEYERELQTICFATDDAREGRAAFKEKRDPVFRRR